MTYHESPLFAIRMLLGPTFGAREGFPAAVTKIAVACDVSPTSWMRAEEDIARVLGQFTLNVITGLRPYGLFLTMNHLWGYEPLPALEPKGKGR